VCFIYLFLEIRCIMGVEINLYLAIVSRVVVLSIFSIYLFRRWWQSEKRFYSDFPFLISLTMGILAVAKLYDLWIYDYYDTLNLEVLTGTDPFYLFLGKIRYLLIIANTLPLFAIMVNIWFNERERIKFTLIIAFTSFWGLYIFFAPNYTYLKNALVFMILPMAVLSVITYIFLYKHQRLPEIHSLVIGIAWIGYIISSIFRPALTELGTPPWGFTWLAELIDVVIWSVMSLGYLIKPPYYYSKETEIA
jgi:hypothetical protein